MTETTGQRRRARWPRWLRRGPWEAGALVLIAAGVVMLTQPFFAVLYAKSFMVILAGTLGYLVVSHFPER